MSHIALEAGSLIANRYQVQDCIGSGSTSEVYSVADRATDEEVALKVLHDDVYRRPEGQARFRQEFRWMHSLRHPNLTEVREFGTLPDGCPFFTMQLVHGLDPADLIGAPIDVACTVAAHLCRALGFLHSRHLMHRDLKPANLKVQLLADAQSTTQLWRNLPRPAPGEVQASRIRVKLLDFGFMAQVGVEVGEHLMGTPDYMAPEVLRGSVVDHRSDLYSLGVLLYELLVGEVPFRGKSPVETMVAHLEQPPPSPRTARPELPDALDALVLRLLAKFPEDRPDSAEAVLSALSEWCPVPTQPTQKVKESYLYACRLVGRQKELHWLHEQVMSASQGQGRGVLVSAPAGGGKSRLLTELRLELQLAGVQLGVGLCQKFTRNVPGAALQQALAPLFLAAAAASGTPSPEAPRLVKVSPVLARAWPQVKPAAALSDAVQELKATVDSLLRGVRELVASRPMVLILEDAHWADDATLGFLAELLAVVPDLPLLIVVSVRADDTDTPRAVHRLMGPGLQRLDLAPFDRDSVPGLLRDMLGNVRITPPVEAHLAVSCGGNLFFLGELLRYLIGENLLRFQDGAWHFPPRAEDIRIPETVQSLLRARLFRLSPAARRVLAAAAVLNARFDVGLLLAASGLPEDDLFEALDELASVQLLSRVGGVYRFVHQLAAEEVYASLPEDVRRVLHAGVGEAMAHRREDVRVAELAFHFREAGDVPRAWQYGQEAAEEAFSANAVREATRAYVWLDEMADKHPELTSVADREALWRRLIKVSITFDEQLSMRYTRRMLAADEAWGSLHLVARLAPWTGATLACVSAFGATMVADRKASMRQIMQRARRIVTYLAVECTWLATGGDMEACRRGTRRLLGWVTDRRRIPYASYLLARSTMLYRQGQYRATCREMETLRRILETDRKTPADPYYKDLMMGAFGYGQTAISMALRSNPQCLEWVDRLRGLAESSGIHLLELQQHIILAIYYGFRGETEWLQNDRDAFEEGVRLHGLNPGLRFERSIGLAWLHIERGEEPQAREVIATIARLDPENRFNQAWEKLLLARLAPSRSEALTRVDACMALARHPALRSVQVLVKALWVRGELLLAAGDLAAADACAEEAIRLCTARDTWCEFDQMLAWRLRGCVASAQGRRAVAEQALGRSLAVARTMGNPIQEAFTLNALATHLGQDTLVQATALLQRIGHAPLEKPS